ncbi:MAG: hypothetical protein Q9166_005944 [cf. Caloplaca sp. 2 TL-2023]
MPLDTRCPDPERRVKRTRELDDSDVECAPASKRHRLPTPSTSDHCLGKTLASPGIVPTQPKSAGSLKRFLDERPIHSWLETVPSVHRIQTATPVQRTKSAPARLTGQRALAIADSDDYRQSFFNPFHDIPKSPPPGMPQSQGQSLGGTSVASGQSSRPATSSSIYRSILRNNGVRMDHTGDKIPKELRDFLDTEILKRRTSKILPEDVSATIQTAVNIADSAEGNIFDLVGTAMFPVKRFDIGRGGNTPWSTDAVPKTPQYSNSLATPKPDVHIGYPTDMQTTWTSKENAVVDHRAATPYTRPARGNSFPFLVFELKSEAAGGTLWQAENQAAGSGAHCVNSMRWFLREAYPSKALSVLDAVAFTIAVTHREAIYHIHFYSEENATNYMSWIGTFSTLRGADIQRSNDATENILEYGLGTRQRKIRNALGDMWPCLERWKPSRPASVLDPQVDSALDSPLDNQSSSKSLRLE